MKSSNVTNVTLCACHSSQEPKHVRMQSKTRAGSFWCSRWHVSSCFLPSWHREGKERFCIFSVLLVEHGGALESCVWFAWRLVLEEGWEWSDRSVAYLLTAAAAAVRPPSWAEQSAWVRQEWEPEVRKPCCTRCHLMSQVIHWASMCSAYYNTVEYLHSGTLNWMLLLL